MTGRHDIAGRIGGSIVALALAATVVVAQGQTFDAQRPSTTPTTAWGGRARIRGRVTDADSGLPLRRAEVRLSPATGSYDRSEFPAVATDDDGRFEMTGLIAGRFRLTASKAGFVPWSYGQRRANDPGRFVEIAAGQSLDRIDIVMPKGAAITVRVVDLNGDPASGVRVQLQQYRYRDGERRLVPIDAPGLDGTRGTNDLGEQRLYGLTPGDYYVMTDGFVQAVSPSLADAVRSYVPTYWPGTTTAGEAQRVPLGPGNQVVVTIPMVASRVARVSGIVQRSDGKLAERGSVSLRSGNGRITGVTLEGGRFAFANVIPGAYTLVFNASISPMSANAEYGEMPITVDGTDAQDVVLRARASGSISGRIVFDDGPPPEALKAGMIQVLPGSSRGVGFQIGLGPGWTFRVDGLPGSGALMVTQRPDMGTVPQYALKAVMIDGRDVTDEDIDFSGNPTNVQVVVTRAAATVTGVAKDAQGKMIDDYVVVLFPQDRAQWTPTSRYFATARPNQQGRFAIDRLPAGRYLAAAVDDLESGEERDPELLQQLESRATSVTLAEGQSRSVDLKVVTVAR